MVDSMVETLDWKSVENLVDLMVSTREQRLVEGRDSCELRGRCPVGGRSHHGLKTSEVVDGKICARGNTRSTRA